MGIYTQNLTMNRAQLRLASAGDAAAIAGIHPGSWMRHDRGAYLDAYLARVLLK